MQCVEPTCLAACPLGVDIPKFIRCLREGNAAGAYAKIREANYLPGICGRICSAPCQDACVMAKEGAALQIRALERYASDFGRPRFAKNAQIKKRVGKVAIVGGGPAGLIATAYLSQVGFQVTLYEAFDQLGGVLRYGVPEFRLPKKVLLKEAQMATGLGVNVETTCFVGKTRTVTDMQQQGFDAILLTTGAGKPKLMDLKGTNAVGVYYGEEFLMHVNLSRANLFSKHIPKFILGERVVVVGSGNTALDCARAAVRFGCKVTLIFRQTQEEMRCRKEERIYAIDEGVCFESLTRPVGILSDNKNFVNGLRCVHMDYAQSDDGEHWELIEVPDSEFIMEAETVILAIGHQPNKSALGDMRGVKCDANETLKVNNEMMTSVKGVFAAGNVVTNSGPLVEAIASGKKVAGFIESYLMEKK